MTSSFDDKPEFTGDDISVGTHRDEPPPPAPRTTVAPPPPPPGRLKGDTAQAVGFLKRLTEAGSHPFHTLTAIHIDPKTHEKGLIETRSFREGDWLGISKWIEPRQGKANLYWAVNPLRTPKDSKSSKFDVASFVMSQVDIDVDAGEEQESAIADMLARVQKLRLEPSIVINSGGGIQLFYVWQDPLPLNGEPAAIAAAEALTKGIEVEVARSLGLEPDATFDCNRIMRLPGTINVPDIKKIEKGRVPALARVVHMGDLKYPRSAFEPATSGVPAASSGNTPAPAPAAKGLGRWSIDGREMAVDFDKAQNLYRSEGVTLGALEKRGVAEPVLKALREGGSDGRSERLASIAHGLLTAGLSPEECGAVMMDDAYPGNAHATEKKPRERNRAIKRALAKAGTSIEGARRRAEADRKGMPRWKDTYDEAGCLPMPTHPNAKLAVEALGLACRYNEFKLEIEMSYAGESVVLQEIAGGLFNDRVTHRIRDVIEERFHFDPGEKNVHDAIHSLAYKDSYNPVVDYLDECEEKWDGVSRLDTFCSQYFGVEDSPYNVEVMRTMLLGSVARARWPGCKFDTAGVLEGDEGIGKSSFVEILYGSANYSDEKILGMDGRSVQELLAGVWGYEISEMAGMSRAEIEQTKGFISKTHDRGRGAYARNKANQPRSNVFWGTTNDKEYLLSQTGNRRWLPIFLDKSHIDLAVLKRDRDQIWGEASARLSKGERYALKPEFRTVSKAEQEQRLVVDPWEDKLRNIPASRIGKSPDGAQQRVATAVLLEQVLLIPTAQQTGTHTRRLAYVMRRLGWTGGVFRDGDKTWRGWTRPAPVVAPPTTKAPVGDEIPF